MTHTNTHEQTKPKEEKTMNTTKQRYPVYNAITNNDGEAVLLAAKIAVLTVTKTLYVLKLKNDGSNSQYDKVRTLFTESRRWKINHPDVEDMIQTACTAFYEAYSDGVNDDETMFKYAYRAINNYIYDANKTLLSRDGRELPRNYGKYEPYIDECARASYNMVLELLFDDLLSKQQQTLQCLIEGYDVAQMCESMNIARRTTYDRIASVKKQAHDIIDTYLHNIYDCNSRMDWRFNNGVLEMCDTGVWVSVK